MYERFACYIVTQINFRIKILSYVTGSYRIRCNNNKIFSKFKLKNIYSPKKSNTFKNRVVWYNNNSSNRIKLSVSKCRFVIIRTCGLKNANNFSRGLII